MMWKSCHISPKLPKGFMLTDVEINKLIINTRWPTLNFIVYSYTATIFLLSANYEFFYYRPKYDQSRPNVCLHIKVKI